MNQEDYEKRIAELIIERDQYDEQRRAAMRKVEEYRKECISWRTWRKQLLQEVMDQEVSISLSDMIRRGCVKGEQ